MGSMWTHHCYTSLGSESIFVLCPWCGLRLSQLRAPRGPSSQTLTCHISILTALVPFLFKTPTPTTLFNHAYVPLIPVSNFPLNIVLPSGNGNPSVTTTTFVPSSVRIAYRASGLMAPCASVKRQSAPRLRTVPVGSLAAIANMTSTS
jgi:hypothetical protein